MILQMQAGFKCICPDKFYSADINQQMNKNDDFHALKFWHTIHFHPLEIKAAKVM